MSKTIKIIIGLILCVSVLVAVGYASREYWMGSIIIYAISDSEDRNNLDVTPEKHEITISDNMNCSEFEFYSYKMCLPWNDVQDQIMGDGEVVGWVRFNNGPMIVVNNPEFEGNIRSDLLIYSGEDKFADLPKKHADELRYIVFYRKCKIFLFRHNSSISFFDNDFWVVVFQEHQKKLGSESSPCHAPIQSS